MSVELDKVTGQIYEEEHREFCVQKYLSIRSTAESEKKALQKVQDLFTARYPDDNVPELDRLTRWIREHKPLTSTPMDTLGRTRQSRRAAAEAVKKLVEISSDSDESDEEPIPVKRSRPSTVPANRARVGRRQDPSLEDAEYNPRKDNVIMAASVPFGRKSYSRTRPGTTPQGPPNVTIHPSSSPQVSKVTTPQVSRITTSQVTPVSQSPQVSKAPQATYTRIPQVARSSVPPWAQRPAQPPRIVPQMTVKASPSAQGNVPLLQMVQKALEQGTLKTVPQVGQKTIPILQMVQKTTPQPGQKTIPLLQMVQKSTPQPGQKTIPLLQMVQSAPKNTPQAAGTSKEQELLRHLKESNISKPLVNASISLLRAVETAAASSQESNVNEILKKVIQSQNSAPTSPGVTIRTVPASTVSKPQTQGVTFTSLPSVSRMVPSQTMTTTTVRPQTRPVVPVRSVPLMSLVQQQPQVIPGVILTAAPIKPVPLNEPVMTYLKEQEQKEQVQKEQARKEQVQKEQARKEQVQKEPVKKEQVPIRTYSKQAEISEFEKKIYDSIISLNQITLDMDCEEIINSEDEEDYSGNHKPSTKPVRIDDVEPKPKYIVDPDADTGSLVMMCEEVHRETPMISCSREQLSMAQVRAAENESNNQQYFILRL